MITWRFAGYYMLIILTGLQAIPRDVYEAARVDGAGRWQHVAPASRCRCCARRIALVLVLSVTGSLLAFDQFFILTGGRHGTATVPSSGHLPRGVHLPTSAGRPRISVILLVLLVAINCIQVRFLRAPADER